MLNEANISKDAFAVLFELAKFRKKIDELKDKDNALARVLYQKYTQRFKQAQELGLPMRIVETILDDISKPPGSEIAEPGTSLYEEYKIDSHLKIASLIDQIDWQSEQHSIRKAYVMGCLSQISYGLLGGCELGQIRRSLAIPSELLGTMLDNGAANIIDESFERMGLRYERLDRGDYLYLIIKHSKATFVAIRGTNTAFDVITDLDAPPRLGRKNPSYHRGFKREAEQSFKEIMQRVRGRNGPIWLTGHSMGGAVAAIINQQNVTHGCYTFACPRFANEAATKIRQPYSYVRQRDLVPCLPPRILGYADAASPHFVVEPLDDFAWSGREMLKSWFVSENNMTKQHGIEGYRSKIALMMDPQFPDTFFACNLFDRAKRARNVEKSI